MSNNNNSYNVKRITVIEADFAMTSEGRTDCTNCPETATLVPLTTEGPLKLCEDCWEDAKANYEKLQRCVLKETRI